MDLFHYWSAMSPSHYSAAYRPGIHGFLTQGPLIICFLFSCATDLSDILNIKPTTVSYDQGIIKWSTDQSKNGCSLTQVLQWDKKKKYNKEERYSFIFTFTSSDALRCTTEPVWRRRRVEIPEKGLANCHSLTNRLHSNSSFLFVYLHHSNQTFRDYSNISPTTMWQECSFKWEINSTSHIQYYCWRGDKKRNE